MNVKAPHRPVTGGRLVASPKTNGMTSTLRMLQETRSTKAPAGRNKTLSLFCAVEAGQFTTSNLHRFCIQLSVAQPKWV